MKGLNRIVESGLILYPVSLSYRHPSISITLNLLCEYVTDPTGYCLTPNFTLFGIMAHCTLPDTVDVSIIGLLLFVEFQASV